MRVALLLLFLAGCRSSGGDGDPAGSEYFAHRGGVLDTFAMVAMTGAPSAWTDPATADWPSSTISMGALLRGANWEVWRDAILARNPALAADIALFDDSNGAPRVQYAGEAAEHYLSMHKWVVFQHAPPPRTLERIRSRSRVGTRFGLFCSFEAVGYTRAWTHVLRPAQDALLPYYLPATRANANGHLHVDVAGATPHPDVPAIESTGLTDISIPGRWWYVDIRPVGAAAAVWAETERLDDIYGGSMDFFYWDNVLFNPYYGAAQFYTVGSVQQKSFANAPWTSSGPVPDPPPFGLPVSNPAPMTSPGYRQGWQRLLGMHRDAMTTRHGDGPENLRRMTWGNSSYPPAPEYSPGLLGVAYDEWFFGNTGISQPLPTLASIQSRIDQAAAENRPMVIAQTGPFSGPPQALWLASAGPGGANGTWADIVARVASSNATVYVQTTRDWSFWHPGFLAP